MPSQRRIRTFLLLTVLLLLLTLYISRSASQTRTSPFYTRTKSALGKQSADDAAAAAAVDADISRRLREAEEKAKASAAKKGKEAQEVVKGDVEEKVLGGEAKPKGGEDRDALGEGTGEKSVAGRKMMKEEVLKDEKKDDGVARVGNKGAAATGKGGETGEEHEVEVELNAILKKSPIIVFSKSYCPFSKKAKSILLSRYRITPSPYVVELDVHPLGPQLQAALAKSTGRRTVPNILINGRSIGGGDDIEALHQKRKLVDTVTSMGGKRIVEAKLIEPEPGREPKSNVKRWDG